MQRCSAHGCKNEWGKTGISVLYSDLHLLLSAGNAERPALHGSKRIMERCNTYGQKLGNCLQRCKCRTNEKSRGNLDLGMAWAYYECGKWLLCMTFTKQKTNAALQQFTKTIWHETDRVLLPDVFYKWDRFWTNLRQKAGHLSGHAFLELGGFMGQWKNCCLVQIGIFPIWFQLISKRIPM